MKIFRPRLFLAVRGHPSTRAPRRTPPQTAYAPLVLPPHRCTQQRAATTALPCRGKRRQLSVEVKVQVGGSICLLPLLPPSAPQRFFAPHLVATSSHSLHSLFIHSFGASLVACEESTSPFSFSLQPADFPQWQNFNSSLAPCTPLQQSHRHGTAMRSVASLVDHLDMAAAKSRLPRRHLDMALNRPLPQHQPATAANQPLLQRLLDTATTLLLLQPQLDTDMSLPLLQRLLDMAPRQRAPGAPRPPRHRTAQLHTTLLRPALFLP